MHVQLNHQCTLTLEEGKQVGHHCLLPHLTTALSTIQLIRMILLPEQLNVLRGKWYLVIHF